MTQILEIRLYKLGPGTRAEFQNRFATEIVPMLERSGIAVVAAGPSLHDADSFFLMRAFADVEERESSLASFYGGSEWLTTHEEAVMGMIDTYNTVVLEASRATIDALRRGIA